KVTLTLEDGKTFVVESSNNQADSPYIQQAWLNGKALDKSWLNHHVIQAGGKLHFDMGQTPNKAWASSSSAQPYSMSLEASRP
ncbi:glycoside hydrolase domain-containing protein, partial [Bowmanella dokdonensis]